MAVLYSEEDAQGELHCVLYVLVCPAVLIPGRRCLCWLLLVTRLKTLDLQRLGSYCRWAGGSRGTLTVAAIVYIIYLVLDTVYAFWCIRS